MPILQAADWPWSHPQIYLQSQTAVDSGLYDYYARGSYTAYLLSPSAPVYNLRTPLPVTNYAHLLQSSWWEIDFRRYGHQALRISRTTSQDSQSCPIRATLTSRYNNFESLLSKQKSLFLDVVHSRQGVLAKCFKLAIGNQLMFLQFLLSGARTCIFSFLKLHQISYEPKSSTLFFTGYRE